MRRVLTTSISSSRRMPLCSTVPGTSAAIVGATSKLSASAKLQAATRRLARQEDESVAIVIRLNIGMVRTKLSINLDWPGCRAVMQLYHMRVLVLGKIELMRGI